MQYKQYAQGLYSAGNLSLSLSLLLNFLFKNFRAAKIFIAKRADARSVAALFVFVLLFSAAQGQVLSTDEKIEVLGLTTQSSEVVSVAVDGAYTLPELEQANKVKLAGISDSYIIYILINRIKLTEDDIAKTKGHISSGLSESIVKKSLSEKQRFATPETKYTNEKGIEEVQTKKNVLSYYRNQINLRLGPAFPFDKLGVYGSLDYNNGSAKTGFFLNLNYCINVGRYFALDFQLPFVVNAINRTKYASIYANSNSVTFVSVSDSKYLSISALVGPKLIIPGKKLSFDLKINIGAGYFYRNPVRIGYSIGNNGYSLNYSSYGSFSSIINVGAGFNIRLSDNSHLLLSCDFLLGNPSKSSLYRGTKSYSDGGSSYYTHEVTMYTVNLGVGLAFEIGKKIEK